MKVFKCKMCGGDLDVKEGTKIITCPYCNSTQTITTLDDEKVLKSFDRGNKLRSSGEFAKAYSIFEQLIVEGCKDAEVYWNLLLCKYGITYVDDYDGRKKPTINRMSMDLFTDDEDYKKCLALADSITKEQYEAEAKVISKAQSKIIKIVKEEKPYDIFISYKETDEYGDRTRDSLLAQDIYDDLTNEGYRVFISRVSLSSVAGSEFEPYIYSALFTSKMMLLVTTSEDYVNSVWVKNEWTRYLDMMENDKEKVLIPCYKGVDPYDLPKQLRNIQGIDFSKIGAIQDLRIGVNKVFGRTKKDTIGSATTVKLAAGNIASMIKRCYILLEDGDYDKVKMIADQMLNEDPENAEIYGIALLADHKCTYEELCDRGLDLSRDSNYKKIMRFGDDAIKKRFKLIVEKFCDGKLAQLANIRQHLVERKYEEDLKLFNELKDTVLPKDLEDEMEDLKEFVDARYKPIIGFGEFKATFATPSGKRCLTITDTGVLILSTATNDDTEKSQIFSKTNIWKIGAVYLKPRELDVYVVDDVSLVVTFLEPDRKVIDKFCYELLKRLKRYEGSNFDVQRKKICRPI